MFNMLILHNEVVRMVMPMHINKLFVLKYLDKRRGTYFLINYHQ